MLTYEQQSSEHRRVHAYELKKRESEESLAAEPSRRQGQRVQCFEGGVRRRESGAAGEEALKGAWDKRCASIRPGDVGEDG